jgi:hypothetical protein
MRDYLSDAWGSRCLAMTQGTPRVRFDLVGLELWAKVGDGVKG